MFRVLLFSFLFVTSNLSAQFWLTAEEEYVFVGTGLDARNAIIGGTVNPASYDGTFSFGYRNGGFSMIGYYENFTGIRFQMLSLNPGFVVRPEKKTYSGDRRFSGSYQTSMEIVSLARNQ